MSAFKKLLMLLCGIGSMFGCKARTSSLSGTDEVLRGALKIVDEIKGQNDGTIVDMDRDRHGRYFIVGRQENLVDLCDAENPSDISCARLFDFSNDKDFRLKHVKLSPEVQWAVVSFHSSGNSKSRADFVRLKNLKASGDTIFDVRLASNSSIDQIAIYDVGENFYLALYSRQDEGIYLVNLTNHLGKASQTHQVILNNKDLGPGSRFIKVSGQLTHLKLFYGHMLYVMYVLDGEDMWVESVTQKREDLFHATRYGYYKSRIVLGYLETKLKAQSIPDYKLTNAHARGPKPAFGKITSILLKVNEPHETSATLPANNFDRRGLLHKKTSLRHIDMYIGSNQGHVTHFILWDARRTSKDAYENSDLLTHYGLVQEVGSEETFFEGELLFKDPGYAVTRLDINFALAQEGDLVAVYNRNMFMKIWRIQERRVLQELQLAQGAQLMAAQSVGPLGSVIFGGASYGLRVWHYVRALMPTQLGRHQQKSLDDHNEIAWLSFFPDGLHVLSYKLDQELLIWKVNEPLENKSTATGRDLWSMRSIAGVNVSRIVDLDLYQSAQKSWVAYIQQESDKNGFAATSLWLWDWQTPDQGKQKIQLNHNLETLTSLSFSPSAQYLYLSSGQKIIQVDVKQSLAETSQNQSLQSKEFTSDKFQYEIVDIKAATNARCEMCLWIKDKMGAIYYWELQRGPGPVLKHQGEHPLTDQTNLSQLMVPVGTGSCRPVYSVLSGGGKSQPGQVVRLTDENCLGKDEAPQTWQQYLNSPLIGIQASLDGVVAFLSENEIKVIQTKKPVGYSLFEQNTAHLRHLKSKMQQAHLEAFQFDIDAFSSFAMSPDRRFAVVGDRRGQLWLWWIGRRLEVNIQPQYETVLFSY